MTRESQIPLVLLIRPGDRVTIVDRFGKKHSGRAVMRSAVGGWVLNMGGPHGTPGLADEDNIVLVKLARGGMSVEDRIAQVKANGERISKGAWWR